MLNLCPKTCRICGPGDFCIADPNDRGAFAEPGALDRNFERIISDPSYQKYKPHGLSKDPWVVAFDNFLEDTEVDAVLDQFQTGWKRSQAGGLIGEDSVMEVRTSEQIWCDSKVCEKKAAMNKLVENIEKITGVPRNHYEDTQMLRYLKGQEYKHHLDWIQGQNTLACGPRLFTFFVYLNDSPDSGTFFSKLNITKPAKKGTAVMWVNVNTTDVWKPDKRVMHLGLPAVQTKFSANIWIHQYDFRNYNDKLCLLADRALEYIPVGGKKQKKEL
jgi:prolyl 4-hydroxylase